jgi:hypothetical protein
VLLMGVLLVSMSAFVAYFGGVGSADAFILLMPTGGAAPSCFTAPAQYAASGAPTFPLQIAGPASPTFPITLCP